MDRAFAFSSRAAAAVVVTTALLALCCCAAARPLGPQEAVMLSKAATTSPLALSPASGYGDAATRAGKWLPYAGAVGYPYHHLPSAFWAHKPVPWVGLGEGARGGGSGAFEGGGGEQEELSYERGESERTKQEQLAMWASLLNRKGKRREASGWLPGEGIGEAADQEPAKTSSDGAAAEGTELDDPAVGGLQVGQSQINSGLYWRNIRN